MSYDMWMNKGEWLSIIESSSMENLLDKSSSNTFPFDIKKTQGCFYRF